MIKDCFVSLPGWVFCGADFNALEDRINTLLTKDRNKMAVYEQGYDGHCLRAHAYFKDQMPDIQLAEKSEICYSANVGGAEIRFKESDTISFQGKMYTGKEFYELVIN